MLGRVEAFARGREARRVLPRGGQQRGVEVAAAPRGSPRGSARRSAANRSRSPASRAPAISPVWIRPASIARAFPAAAVRAGSSPRSRARTDRPGSSGRRPGGRAGARRPAAGSPTGGPTAFASACEASRTNGAAVLVEQRVQVLPDDVRDQRVVAAVGEHVEQDGERLDPFELPGGDRHLQPHVGRRVARPATTTLSRTVGIDLRACSRPPARPRRGSPGRRGPAGASWKSARSGPAPTSAQRACSRALRGALSSRTSACSFAGLAGVVPLGQQPLGDVAVVDVRAVQPLDQLRRRVSFARSNAGARGVSL